MANAPVRREDGSRIAGGIDIWIFVGIEGLIFNSYFIVYMLYRARQPGLYLAAQAKLDPDIGVLNTLLLLTSSWFMARCVHRVRTGNHDGAMRQLALTALLGVGFVASKVVEWSREIDRGLTFSTDEFFSFYYFLTAIHVLHVLIGFGFLAVAAYQLASPARRSQEVVETAATFWHMVDFLWVMIFALLYVMR